MIVDSEGNLDITAPRTGNATYVVNNTSCFINKSNDICMLYNNMYNDLVCTVPYLLIQLK